MFSMHCYNILHWLLFVMRMVQRHGENELKVNNIYLGQNTGSMLRPKLLTYR